MTKINDSWKYNNLLHKYRENEKEDFYGDKKYVAWLADCDSDSFSLCVEADLWDNWDEDDLMINVSSAGDGDGWEAEHFLDGDGYCFASLKHLKDLGFTKTPPGDSYNSNCWTDEDNSIFFSHAYGRITKEYYIKEDSGEFLKMYEIEC